MGIAQDGFVSRNRLKPLIALALCGVMACPAWSAIDVTTATASTDLDQALEHAKLVFKIKPDMRFVRAAEFIVQRLATRPTSATATLTPVEKGWEISCGPLKLGTLPSFGTYADNMSFVKDVARKVITERTHGKPAHQEEIDKGLSAFLLDDILPSVRLVDADWNDSSSPLPLEQAARAALYLMYQSSDEAGVGDEIKSRAIAFFAAATALTSNSMDADNGMLAHCLGYHDEALNQAQTLPEKQPERLFLFNHNDELYALGKKSDATTRTWFMAAGKASGSHDKKVVQEMLSLRKELFSGSHIASAIPLMLHVSDWHEGAETDMKAASYLALWLDGRKFDHPDKEFGGDKTPFSIFEHGLSRLHEKDQGPLLDEGYLKTYYQMIFTNAVEMCMNFYLNIFGSQETALQVADFFGHAQTGLVGEYSRFLQERLSENGSTAESRQRLEKTLESLHGIGANMAGILYGKILAGAEMMSTETLHAGLVQLARMDGRPDERDDLIAIAQNQSFRNPDLVERVLRAKTQPESDSNSKQQLAYFYFMDDMGRIIHKLATPNVPDWLRGRYYGSYLDSDPRMTTQTRADEMDKIYHRNLDNLTITRQYADFLESLGKYDQAIAVQHKYADMQRDSSGLQFPYAKCREAELCAENGKLKKALALVNMVSSSYIALALDGMAEYNARLGNFDEAYKWSAKARDRYSDYGDSMGISAFCCWLKGDYDQAASMISSFKNPLPAQTDTIAGYFRKAMKDKPKAEWEKAISAMEKAGLQSIFGLIGGNFRIWHRFDIQFAFQSRVRESGVQKYRTALVCYDCMKRMKGESDAIEWLKKFVPADELPALASTAFRESSYGLLDSVVPYDDTTTVGRYNWTLRAAAVCASTTAARAMGEKVMKHFATDHSGDFHSVAGRFLLGMADQSNLKASIRTHADLCQAACYLSLKARASGDYRKALDWMEVCILTGQVQLNEYQKARLILGNWTSANKAITVVPRILATPAYQVNFGL